jgi:hypothetical protein
MRLRRYAPSKKTAGEAAGSGLGHSRPGRASSKSGRVRYAADCVEKVLFDLGTNFLRAAGALGFWDAGDHSDPSGFNQRPFQPL